jgi:hypothetical protein
VSLYLGDDLKPYVKIATPSGHVVLNITQGFILVTFKSDIPEHQVHEFGDPRHTVSVYCGRYIRITSEFTFVYLRKNDWKEMLGLSSSCLDRRIIRFDRLQDELLEWRNKCLESKSFCNPPIDFESLYDELCYRDQSFRN